MRSGRSSRSASVESLGKTRRPSSVGPPPPPALSDIQHHRSVSQQGAHSEQQTAATSTGRPLLSHVSSQFHPRHTNYRGYARCKHCNTFITEEPTARNAHEAECTFRPLPCGMEDSETGERCTVVARGPELLERHQRRCPMRLIECTSPGCDALVSMRSLSTHLVSCSQELVRCVACQGKHPRSAEALHELHCPEMIVPCPLGCGREMRRGDVPRHLRDSMLDHQPKVFAHQWDEGGRLETGAVHPADSADVVFSLLLDKLHEQQNQIAQLRAAKSAGSSPQQSAHGNRGRAAPTTNSPSRSISEQQDDGAARSATPPSRHHHDPSNVELSPFSPGGHGDTSTASSAGAVGPMSRTVFAALATSKEISQTAVESDMAARIESVMNLTQVVHHTLASYRTKALILADDDISSKRATVMHLKEESDAAIARLRRLWNLCGLASTQVPKAETPAELHQLRELAEQVERGVFDMRCALYDCL